MQSTSASLVLSLKLVQSPPPSLMLSLKLVLNSLLLGASAG